MNRDSALGNTKDDKLGRVRFAQEIANGLVNTFENNNESLVIGINGSWGAGKSTLLNFILAEIEKIYDSKDTEHIVLKFNPWLFSGQIELQRIFFNQLLAKLGDKTKALKDVSSKISDILDYLKFMKYVNSGLGEIIESTKTTIDKFTKENDLISLKKDIDEILIDSKTKLFITIDDIDRLTPEEVISIFQLVKLNANFANTTFILAYDLSVVNNSLSQKFGPNHQKYLEKIIQVDYTLPQIPENKINSIFENQLFLILKNADIPLKEIQTLKESGHLKDNPYLITLRDVYRLLNSIQLRIKSIAKELNILDFILLESIRVFNHKLYSFIYGNKSKLIVNNEPNKLYGKNSPHQNLLTFIEGVKSHEFYNDILKKLFIREIDSFYNSSYSQDTFYEKRISNSSYFDRYFNLQLNDYDISEIEFEKFLFNNVKDKVDVLTQIIHSNQLAYFLNSVEVKLRKTYDHETLKSICLATLYALEKAKFSSRPYGSTNYILLLNFVTRLSTSKLPGQLTMDLIWSFQNSYKSEKIFSQSYICETIIKMNAKHSEGKIKYDNYWFGIFKEPKKTVDAFIEKILNLQKVICNSILIRYQKNEIELNYAELSSLIYNLNNLDPLKCQVYTNNLLNNNSKLLLILKGTMLQSWITGPDGTGYCFSIRNLLPSIDIDEVIKKVSSLKISKLTDEEKDVVAFFKNSQKENFNEKKFFAFKTLKPMNSIDSL